MVGEDCEARVWVVEVDPSAPADSVFIVNMGAEEDAAVDDVLLGKLEDDEADWVEELGVSEVEVTVCDKEVLPNTVEVKDVLVTSLVKLDTAVGDAGLCVACVDSVATVTEDGGVCDTVTELPNFVETVE